MNNNGSLRSFVKYTNHIFLFRLFYLCYYFIGLCITRLILFFRRDVASHCFKFDFRRNDFYFGSSDIDIMIFLNSDDFLSESYLKNRASIWKLFLQIRFFFPFISFVLKTTKELYNLNSIYSSHGLHDFPLYNDDTPRQRLSPLSVSNVIAELFRHWSNVHFSWKNKYYYDSNIYASRIKRGFRKSYELFCFAESAIPFLNNISRNNMREFRPLMKHDFRDPYTSRELDNLRFLWLRWLDNIFKSNYHLFSDCLLRQSACLNDSRFVLYKTNDSSKFLNSNFKLIKDSAVNIFPEINGSLFVRFSYGSSQKILITIVVDPLSKSDFLEYSCGFKLLKKDLEIKGFSPYFLFATANLFHFNFLANLIDISPPFLCSSNYLISQDKHDYQYLNNFTDGFVLERFSSFFLNIALGEYISNCILYNEKKTIIDLALFELPSYYLLFKHNTAINNPYDLLSLFAKKTLLSSRFLKLYDHLFNKYSIIIQNGEIIYKNLSGFNDDLDSFKELIYFWHHETTAAITSLFK